LETLRSQQLQNLEANDAFTAHGLDAEPLAVIQALFTGKAREHIAEAYLARRVIAADAASVQWVLCLRLSWWGRRRAKQTEVVNRLARLEWPVPLLFVSLDGRLAPWLKALRKLPGARLM
jgi:hypothetical protein